MSRSLKAGIGVVLTLVLAFGLWAALHSSNPVFESVVAPVKTTIVPPQYAALLNANFDADPPGLVVRAGKDVRKVPDGIYGVWLDDGRYVLSRATTYTCPDDPDADFFCHDLYASVLDPSTGRTATIPGLGKPGWPDVPGEALHRLTLVGSRPTSDVPVDVLLSYRADLTAPHRLELPEYDGKSKAMSRNTDRRVFSIGDWDYVRYSDNDGEDATESYGYLRQKAGSERWQKVLVDKRLVALWVSRDGRALLGLQQKHGEPCGGCTKSQQIVEIDPNKGVIAGTYGVPKNYDKSWRVAEIDKVDDRVLVRYVHRGNMPENLGVWQYNGSWKLVDGTDGAFTWWQGPKDRIEARPMDVEPVAEDLVPFELIWVHGSKRTTLAGHVYPEDIAGWSGIPGSLVPPE